LFFWWVWCLNSGLYMYKVGTLLLDPHTSSPFCSGYSGDRVSRTICLGWPRTDSSWHQPPRWLGLQRWATNTKPSTGVWAQGLVLARQALCYLSHSASPILNISPKSNNICWILCLISCMNRLNITELLL
jgi:hypothetical protein